MVSKRIDGVFRSVGRSFVNGLSDFDAVYVAMSFLVPGYVYFVVRGHLVPGHRSRGNESIIRLLSVSTVNFSIWAWAVYMVIEMEDAPVWARGDGPEGVDQGLLPAYHGSIFFIQVQ